MAKDCPLADLRRQSGPKRGVSDANKGCKLEEEAEEDVKVAELIKGVKKEEHEIS